MHEVVEEKSLNEKLPSFVTDTGKDTLTKETKSKKDAIGSQPKGNHNVFTHFPKEHKCEVCKKTKTTRVRSGIKLERRVDGIAFSTEFGDLITTDRNIPNAENESTC